MVGLWEPPVSASGPYQVNALSKHQAPVKALAFNGINESLLASAANEDEICVWDVSKPQEPTLFEPLRGQNSAEVAQLEWNPQVEYILATAIATGPAVVWDLRKGKPIHKISDSEGRRKSAIQWNKETATHLAVASDDDRSPAIQIWDLRQALSPFMELRGHSKGVLSLSWCPSDPTFLLSTGKDGRCLLWDCKRGEIAGEFQRPLSGSSADWVFDCGWSAVSPGLCALSGADGVVSLHNASTALAPPSPAPRWLQRPCSTSVGFGGRVAVNSGKSGVRLFRTAVPETEGAAEQEEAKAAFQSSSAADFCAKKAEDSSNSTEERRSWRLLACLFDADPRRAVLAELGYGEHLAKLEQRRAESEATADAQSEGLKGQNDKQREPAIDAHSLFDTLAEDGEEPAKADETPEFASATGEADSVEQGWETPAILEAGGDDRDIEELLAVGDWDGASMAAEKRGKLVDSLLLASCGGEDTFAAARKRVMDRLAPARSYVGVARAISQGDFQGLIDSRRVAAWEETLALLCSYAPEAEFPDLCGKLADKLRAGGFAGAASACDVCAGRVDNVAALPFTGKGRGKSLAAIASAAAKCALVLRARPGTLGHQSSSLLAAFVSSLAEQSSVEEALSVLDALPRQAAASLPHLRDRLVRSRDDQQHQSTQKPQKQQQQWPHTYYQHQHDHQAMPHFSHSGTAPHPQYQRAHHQPQQQQQPQPSHFQAYNLRHAQQHEASHQHAPHSQPQPQPTTPPTQYHYHQQQPPPPQPQPMQHQQGQQQAQPKSQPNVFTPVPQSPLNQPRPAVSEEPSQPPREQQEAQPEPKQERPTKPQPPPDAAISSWQVGNIPDADLRSAAETLKRCHASLQVQVSGTNARELEDADKRCGRLAWQMEQDDLSADVRQKVTELCSALASGDPSSASLNQVSLTTENWQECKDWISGIKRLIKLLKAHTHA